MPKKTASSSSKTAVPPRAPNLQISNDSNELLNAFVEKHPYMTKTDVVRAALGRFLPDLVSGKLVIVNGNLVSREELQAVPA